MRTAIDHIKHISRQKEVNLLESDSSLGNLSLPSQILAGSFAGTTELVSLFPLDTIKTHMQAGTERLGFFRTFSALYGLEGIVRLYRGMNAALIGTIPSHAAFFSIYEIARKKFNTLDGQLHWCKGLMVGISTTIAHDLLDTPMDVVKQRLQLRGRLSIKNCISELLAKEGISSLFRSLPITILMNTPFNAIMISIYENTKIILNPKKWNYPFIGYFYCASIAGSIAALITHPMDVIKTKLQTQHSEPKCSRIQELLRVQPTQITWCKRYKCEEECKSTSPHSEGIKCAKCIECKKCPRVPKMAVQTTIFEYSDILSTMRNIYIRDGYQGFGRGILPRAFNSSLAVTISWLSYEFIKSILFSSNTTHI